MATNSIIPFITRLVVTFVMLAISIGIVIALVNTKPELAIATGDRALQAVIVIEAKPVPMQRRTVGYGAADAMLHADIPAEISSTVIALPPTSRAGRKIRKGDLVVELDDVDYQQQLIRAQQALSSAKSALVLLEIERHAAEKRAVLSNEDKSLAEAECDRIMEAFKKGAAKQREVDSAKQKLLSVSSVAINANESASRFPSREEQASSAVATREAEVAIAQQNVRRCHVVSPIDGVLQTIDVRVGELVSNGKRIARVVNSSHVEIPLRLPSHARAYVRVGDTVTLRSAGFGKRYWDARISRIAPEDDTTSRTIVVYVDLNQDPFSASSVPPGLFVRGEVKSLRSDRLRWVVPRRSIRDDRIMVIRDSILRSIPVSIEYSITGKLPEFSVPDEDWAVLETVLDEGDFIVVDPGGSLRDGMSVRKIFASQVSSE
jgi:RND family efflux transporter MFP subunit